ncbi:MAG: crossover junction endodeoxyribonuclease RuvC [Ktedonobacteraceae bacterium]
MSLQRAPPERVILGIDPGIAIMGYAFLQEQQEQFHLLVCDVIRTPKHTPLPDRLHVLYEHLTVLLSTYHPTEVAMETLFFGRNRTTAMMVSHARGVCMLALAFAHLPLFEYTPSQVKKAVTGSGTANKLQVGECVQTFLSLPTVPTPDDAADAAAVAVCHVFQSAVSEPQVTKERIV